MNYCKECKCKPPTMFPPPFLAPAGAKVTSSERKPDAETGGFQGFTNPASYRIHLPHSEGILSLGNRLYLSREQAEDLADVLEDLLRVDR